MSLDAKVRRAIRIHEGQDVDASAFKVLIRVDARVEARVEELGWLRPDRVRVVM